MTSPASQRSVSSASPSLARLPGARAERSGTQRRNEILTITITEYYLVSTTYLSSILRMPEVTISCWNTALSSDHTAQSVAARMSAVRRQL